MDEKDQNVKKTVDYTIFNKLLGNRKLNDQHLNALKKSIEKENLLHLRPILVNKEMNVLDGQHRLAIAEKLGLPIYYIIVDNAGAQQVARLNSNQKNWKPLDYLTLYIEAYKNQEYITLKEFMSTYNLDLYSAFAIIKYPIKRLQYKENFFNGDFVFPDPESAKNNVSKYNSFLNLVKHHDIKPIIAFETVTFINSYMMFTDSKKIQYEVLWEKLEKHWSKIGKRYNIDEYLQMLLDIYNMNSPYKILMAELF